MCEAKNRRVTGGSLPSSNKKRSEAGVNVLETHFTTAAGPAASVGVFGKSILVCGDTTLRAAAHPFQGFSDPASDCRDLRRSLDRLYASPNYIQDPV